MDDLKEQVVEEIEQAHADFWTSLAQADQRTPDLMPEDMTIERYANMTGNKPGRASRLLQTRVEEGLLREEWRIDPDTGKRVKAFVVVEQAC